MTKLDLERELKGEKNWLIFLLLPEVRSAKFIKVIFLTLQQKTLFIYRMFYLMVFTSQKHCLRKK